MPGHLQGGGGATWRRLAPPVEWTQMCPLSVRFEQQVLRNRSSESCIKINETSLQDDQRGAIVNDAFYANIIIDCADTCMFVSQIRK